MVMCDDERLRSNRLALMQLLADLFLTFADFTRLRGEEEYE
jgi:glycyl-tRNA synthetase beta subunit